MPDPDQLTRDIQDLVARVDATLKDVAPAAPGHAALRCTNELLQRAANAASVAAGRMRTAG